MMAGENEEFEAGLHRVGVWASDLLGLTVEKLPHYELHRPVTARSYGASNASVWQEIGERALDSGLLLDPVYTAKLSACYRQWIAESGRSGRDLLIHSGGGLNLLGYKKNWLVESV